MVTGLGVAGLSVTGLVTLTGTAGGTCCAPAAVLDHETAAKTPMTAKVSAETRGNIAVLVIVLLLTWIGNRTVSPIAGELNPAQPGVLD